MVLRTVVVAVILFGLGPLAAGGEVIRPMTGFAMFTIGGILGAVGGIWGAVQALRGRGWVAPMMGLVVAVPFLAVSMPAARFPPYNDFTTDTVDPPAFVNAVNLAANRGRDMSYPGGTVVEAQRLAYPYLQPFDIDVPPADAFARVTEAASRVLAWHLSVQDSEAGVVEGVATSSIFHFRDDFVIRVRARAGGSRIDMRSKSRDGKGDLGANATRIRRFFAMLAIAGPT